VLRTLLLCVLVVGAAVALAIGSYSALAGAGPVTSVASAVIGADEPDDGDVVEGADDVDGDDVDGDDADGDDDGDNGKGAQHIAEVIAAEFDASQEDVLALHEQGIGFGAIFKLYLLAAAGETTVEALLSAAEADGGFAFGKRFKEMGDLESGPKNLGQIVSDSHRPEHAGPDAGSGVSAAHESNGHGPPYHARAHGRN